jgi:hypothetical protein
LLPSLVLLHTPTLLLILISTAPSITKEMGGVRGDPGGVNIRGDMGCISGVNGEKGGDNGDSGGENGDWRGERGDSGGD